MIITRVCPDCHARWTAAEKSVDSEGTAELTICCRDCHAKRQAKIQELEAMYPSAESLGLLGSITEIPTERYRRPTSSGKRIFRKSDQLS